MAAGHELHPLILVPGLSGNQLDARLTEDYRPPLPALQAPQAAGWFRIWMDRSLLLDSAAQRCFAHQLSLFYDPDADDFRNVPGVDTRVPFFGSTEGLRFLDPDRKDSSICMDTLVKSLEEIGYQDNLNLFGAPYDFRYSLAGEGHPSKVATQYLQHLRELVEQASKMNGDKPVIILTHSYGGLLTLHLLNRNPSWWRRKFIKHFIAVSAPWGGIVAEMFTFTSGDTIGMPSVDPLIIREQFRRTESNLWLLPSPKTFGDRPLVVTRDRNYSATNMAEFLQAIGFQEGVKPYVSRILPLLEEMAAPGVPVTCIIGVGVDTPETFLYNGEGKFDEPPEVVSGDGDGLVNLASLLALESEWSDAPEQELKVIKIPNATHAGILTQEFAVTEIIRRVLDVNSVPA
ncbi:hypothetical protein C4D60_Mb06t25430 [Musa balbisiana]|uniref:Lecithin-cholesterol acyltransferase-like 1 n=1 Tax=Musa balbisiana TaxID=52838 RepID=A0A4S8IQK0_MUSBA|nr:hypothetical protein C4D60_Mb06t25430 [Musa balbisiana]